MHASPVISVSQLYAFLLVLTRVAGTFVFIPLPGFKAGPDAAKIVLSLAITIALYSRWPAMQNVPAGIAELTGWVLIEAGIGIATGLSVAFVMEGLQVAAQAISTQAGFSYASTIDPNTEADSTVLVMIAQLTAGLLFFTMGLDRQLLGILAHSLETHPPGTFGLSRSSAEALVMLGSGVFSTGLRLVLPLMALLFLIDLSIGLLGRLNSQLQLVALAFPLKMTVAMAALSFLVLLLPKIYQTSAAASFGALGKLLGF
jgi:flagellar biosynthetic protein FliR